MEENKKFEEQKRLEEFERNRDPNEEAIPATLENWNSGRF